MTFQPPPQPGPAQPGPPVSPPPPQPSMMGPGGAYGPAPVPDGQPVPGAMPPTSMTMGKPGTITGIQAILWIFLAIGVVGDLFSVINLVNFFHPLGLVALGYALYMTVQSLLTPIHIARGKRWAWIWNLVNSILGLVFAAVAIVFGVIMIEDAWLSLIFGVVFGALHGTLLGLLCSKSARQWILMHRVRRGQAQAPGAPAATGAPGFGTAAAPQPERPATRPGSATFTAVLLGLLAIGAVWLAIETYNNARVASDELQISIWDSMTGDGVTWSDGAVSLAVSLALLIGVAVSMPAVLRGKASGRIFGIVWTCAAAPAAGLVVYQATDAYLFWKDFLLPHQVFPVVRVLALKWAVLALTVLVFVCMLLPGVRAWTPGGPKQPLMVAVPMAQQQGAPHGYQPQPTAPQGPQPPRYPPPH